MSILSWSTQGANFGVGAAESNRRISISHSYSGSKYFGSSVLSTESGRPPIRLSRVAELCRAVAVVNPMQPPKQCQRAKVANAMRIASVVPRRFSAIAHPPTSTKLQPSRSAFRRSRSTAARSFGPH